MKNIDYNDFDSKSADEIKNFSISHQLNYIEEHTTTKSTYYETSYIRFDNLPYKLVNDTTLIQV